jgi:folate-binding protein YgfZ
MTVESRRCTTQLEDPVNCLRRAYTEAAWVYSTKESRLVLEGRDGLDFLHRISTNSLLNQPVHVLTATALTTEKGRIIDALRVVQYGSGHLLLGSADAEAEVLQWMEKYIIADDVAVRSVTGETLLCALVGPASMETAARLTGNPLTGDAAWPCTVRGIPALAIPDHTTPLERVFFIGSSKDVMAWREWTDSSGLCTLDPEEWDTLRIFFGLPAAPGEISTRFTPYDVGLQGAVSETKGCYIGQEVLARLVTYQKIRRTLVGFVTTVASPPAAGEALFTAGEEAGAITSISSLRLQGRVFGLAVVRRAAAVAGQELSTPSGTLVTISPLPMAFPAEGTSHQ